MQRFPLYHSSLHTKHTQDPILNPTRWSLPLVQHRPHTTRKLLNSDRKNRSVSVTKSVIEKISHYWWPKKLVTKSVTDLVTDSVTDSVNKFGHWFGHSFDHRFRSLIRSQIWSQIKTVKTKEKAKWKRKTVSEGLKQGILRRLFQ